jgi:hypothetical protein
VVSGVDGHPQATLGEADRGGQPAHTGTDHQHADARHPSHTTGPDGDDPEGLGWLQQVKLFRVVNAGLPTSSDLG